MRAARLGLPGLLLALASLGFGARAEPTAAWPKGWQSAYRGFQTFLQARTDSGWMQELEITPQGGFLTTATGGDLLSVFLWWSGAEWAGIGLKPGSDDQPEIWRQAVPGRYAVVIKVASSLGYQHVTPLRWVDLTTGPQDRTTLFGGEKRVLRPAPPPKNPEDVWPNDRLLAWWDWQILPKHHPNDIREKNARVRPAVFLQVDFSGHVHRARLDDPAAERALRWRVYHNGQLVDRRPAAGTEVLATAPFGPGNYLVLAGVDGPDGFFPVSNLLAYSLAPQRPPGLQLAVSQADYGDPAAYPRWFRDVLPPPFGPGPQTYDDAGKLAAARAIVAAWEGAADYGNEPDAPWIRRTPDLEDLRPRAHPSLDPTRPNRFDLDSDADNDGLTLREEMESGSTGGRADTDGDGAR